MNEGSDGRPGQTGGPAPAPLVEMLRARAYAGGEHQQIRLPDGRLTLRELVDRAARFALILADRGCGETSVIVAHCGNGTALVTTWFAALELGAVFLPVNQLLRGQALPRILNQVAPAAVVFDSVTEADASALRVHFPHVPMFTSGRRSAVRRVESLEALLASAPPGETQTPSLDDTRPAKLMYTSGTTGNPKAAVWSRRCEAAWASAYARELIALQPGESAFSCLPLAHVTCQGTLLGALLGGGHVTIDQRFEPFRFWERIRDAEACVFSFVGTILSTLVRRPQRPDDIDNPVRRIVGAATPAQFWKEIEERFQLEIMETWGQTETASCWFAPESLPMRPGTVGRPSTRCDAQLMSTDGVPVPRGNPGELWLRPRAPHLMFDGYLGDRTPPVWEQGGWYRTGDLLIQDSDDNYRFVARTRDAIRRHGELLAPSLIEEVAVMHASVLEAAAVGIPDPRHEYEELIKLCVVAVSPENFDSADLARFLRTRLPRLLLPAMIVAYPHLPKTPTSRVERWRLREPARSESRSRGGADGGDHSR